MAASGIMGFNSLESEGAARGRELLKPIIPSAHVLTITSFLMLPWKQQKLVKLLEISLVAVKKVI